MTTPDARARMSWDDLTAGVIGVLHWAVAHGWDDVAYRYAVFLVGDLFRLYFGCVTVTR